MTLTQTELETSALAARGQLVKLADQLWRLEKAARLMVEYYEPGAHMPDLASKVALDAGTDLWDHVIERDGSLQINIRRAINATVSCAEDMAASNWEHVYRKCSQCMGAGHFGFDVCPDCNGTGLPAHLRQPVAQEDTPCQS